MVGLMGASKGTVSDYAYSSAFRCYPAVISLPWAHKGPLPGIEKSGLLLVSSDRRITHGIRAGHEPLPPSALLILTRAC